MIEKENPHGIIMFATFAPPKGGATFALADPLLKQEKAKERCIGT
jgi:hypothetical protein